MPEISVIVPVYKAEAYLHACIDSILSQTFSGFELILVDDGSPDGCGAICDDYAARDSRVRVIHQENQGQAAARNHALAAAKGDWVCFVDSDDAVHPQMLERLRQGRCRERRGHEHVPDAGSAGNSGGLFRAGGGQLGAAFHGGRTLDGAV